MCARSCGDCRWRPSGYKKQWEKTWKRRSDTWFNSFATPNPILNAHKISLHINFTSLFYVLSCCFYLLQNMHLKLWHGPIIQILHDSLQLFRFKLFIVYALKFIFCFCASKMPIKHIIFLIKSITIVYCIKTKFCSLHYLLFSLRMIFF